MADAKAGGAASKAAGAAAGGAADRRGAEAPRRRMSLLTALSFAFVFLVLFSPELRDQLGRGVGYAFDPVIGFGGDYPVLTILIAGTVMVLLTTLLRHFTTDWIEMAKAQAYMREFQKEFSKARKENNTYKLKKLQDKQPEVLLKQQEMSTKQLKNMPLTMIVVIPLFAWLLLFVSQLDHPYYAAPWNPSVDMFGTTLFPHWILLYMCLSIPLGALVQKTMKYLSWKERWQRRHEDAAQAAAGRKEA